MKLEKIITLANEAVRLPFLAFERSLRATGCNLPLLVIPYDDNTFDLPGNATWWTEPDFIEWVDSNGQCPVMRKYQVLLESNYQFADTDVIFLCNPADTLAPLEGWITSCCHWNNPAETTTQESLEILRRQSTTWARNIFNTGQFACDRKLYTLESLEDICKDKRIRSIVLENQFHEQPGLNVLVNLTDVPITNLTLPPYCMESTWAGDYTEDDFESTWTTESKKPYLIHWAGRKMDGSRAIDQFFINHLTESEYTDWVEKLSNTLSNNRTGKLRKRMRVAWHAYRDFK